jgi:hypothetical protein
VVPVVVDYRDPAAVGELDLAVLLEAPAHAFEAR